MTDEANPDQHNQLKQGPHTEIKEANAPVLSGTFEAPVTIKYYPERQEPLVTRLPFIPDPPPNFTGRDEELKELQSQLDAGKTIIALHGFGGVGKTALSLKLVESIKDRYPDGQIMVDMRGTTNPISPMEAMGSVIRSYHREEKIPDSESETRQRYLEVLKDKRVLLLLDNALDDKQVLKLVPPKGCGLIITSRKTITIPNTLFFKMDLDVLKPGEALELLLNVCCPAAGPQKSTRDDPAWPEIARLCGFLPLALLAAASYLANSEDVSPKKYVKALADERSRLEMIGEQGVDMSVDASLELSFQKLEPKQQQTFLDLSVFPADFDAQAEEQICLDQGNKSLSELVRWSLVDYKSQGPDYGRYRLHDLARIFALARQQEEQKAAISERHAAYYKDLLSAADDLYLKGGDSILAGLALFDREEANILTGQAWAEKNMQRTSLAADLCNDYPKAGFYVLNLRLHPLQNIAWLVKALTAARQLNDRSTEAGHLGNLGLAYADLGEPRKAIEFYEQQLSIAREIGDRRGEGNALGNLGIAYADLGEPRKAIEFHEQALKIFREIGDRRGEGNVLGNLGLAYSNLGEPRKAIEFYEQALAIDREIGDRRGEGADLGNLGNAYAVLGEPRKSIEHYEQALVIAQEIGYRRGESADLGNLGNAYADLGEPRKAIEYYEQALAIAREIGDRRGEGAHLGNLGNAYAALGEPRKSIEFYEQALAIVREIGNRRDEGSALGNLGIAYKNLGEPRKAIEHYEQQLVITREIGDRSGEAIASWNLGLQYEKAGDLQRAAELMQICVDFEREIGHSDAEKDADHLERLREKLRKE